MRKIRKGTATSPLHYGDLTDSTNLIRIIQQSSPRDLQPRRPESRRRFLRGSRIHRQFRRPRDPPHPRGRSHPRPHRQNPHLPGLHLRALRPRPGNTSEGVNTLLSPQPLRRRQALRLLDHGELPRGLRHVCMQRHSVQSRESKTRRNFRNPKDHKRLGSH